ncbi:MAG: V-type ATP synthase subunit A [Bacteroidales bacterium]
MSKTIGFVTGVNESLVTAKYDSGGVVNGEVAYIITEDGKKLKSEVIEVKSNKTVEIQVFEDTSWLRVGDRIEFTGKLLSVKLGPGILGSVTDGLQNPLYELAKIEWFLERGLEVSPLDTTRKWKFTPTIKQGDTVTGGSIIGWVPENLFQHKIFIPFQLEGNFIVKNIKSEGEYTVEDVIAEISDDKNNIHVIKLAFDWPVKKSMPFNIRAVPSETMPTGIRIFDALFPISYGGTACNPGPFGAGKTVLQHCLAKFSQVDVVIIAACGERAGEAVEVFKDFPEIIDPRTGRSLMERTYIVGNTSSMPVAAREASVYIAASVGEYYRKQGLNVLMLADSTSRWAQALRETSGRKEEIPGPEAFPMYISTLIAGFYDRAGVEILPDGKKGSLTIIGTVSPAGGNFDEPVTQATLLCTGAFWGLSRALSDARKYPAIDRLDSNSKYNSILAKEDVQLCKALLREGKLISSNIILMGEKGVTDEAYRIYQKSELLDAVFLQQDSFHKVDMMTTPDRLKKMFAMVKNIIESPIKISGKDKIRTHFNYLRQAFIDWNQISENDKAFTEKEKQILILIEQGKNDTQNV